MSAGGPRTAAVRAEFLGVPRITVPGQRGRLTLPSATRVRRLKRHLIAALRDLRVAKRPERLVQTRADEPAGFAGTVARAGCAHCAGHCCRGGGEHAYIDERTMARVRAERPELDAAAIIRLYTSAVARPGYEGSCLFHGARGCTLDRALRAELCNSYYCDGLKRFLKLNPTEERLVVIVTRLGEQRVVGPGTAETGLQHADLSDSGTS